MTQQHADRHLHVDDTAFDTAVADFSRAMAEHSDDVAAILESDIPLPDLGLDMAGRHALVVTRGSHYKEDLALLGNYIREYKPVLIAVGRGADALVELGYKPDLIVGDMDAVGESAIVTGARLVVHTEPGRPGSGRGVDRLQQLDLDYRVMELRGTDEDAAFIIADGLDAVLIVGVGVGDMAAELMRSGRHNTAATLLTRMRVGAKFVDAKGIALIYHRRIGAWPLLFMIVAGLLALAAALSATAAGQTLLGLLGAQFDVVAGWLAGLFTSDG